RPPRGPVQDARHRRDRPARRPRPGQPDPSARAGGRPGAAGRERPRPGDAPRGDDQHRPSGFRRLTMRVGNAPVSWGILEVAGLSADLPYAKVMDEIASAGYEGTELGPWGYYPTDAEPLLEELRKRGLALASAFCPVELTDRAHHAAATAEVLRVADLLQALGTSEVILADPQRPDRALVAGRAGPQDELSPAWWQALSAGLNEIGARLADRGMRA